MIYRTATFALIIAATVCSLASISAENKGTSVFSSRLLPEPEGVDTVNTVGSIVNVVRTQRIFRGNIINHGTFKVVDSTVTFQGSYTENGAYLSDPSTNYFSDLIIGETGYLTGGVGDIFVVTGDFRNGSTQNVLWSTANAELEFNGGVSHNVLLAGDDNGSSSAAYASNFAWKTVRLCSGQSVVLGDSNAKPGAALYTQALILDDGVGQVANIVGNGCNIYYNPSNSLNAYLGGKSYPLQGGGAISPVQVQLKNVSILALPNKHVVIQCIGVPEQSHTVLTTDDLKQPFAPISTIIAGFDGKIQYEDTNAGSVSRRFYRISYP